MTEPTDTNQASEDEKLARLFHDTYERLAPAFSYKTRKASAVPWAEVPPNNKGLMIAVAHEINDAIRNEKLKLLAEVRELLIDRIPVYDGDDSFGKEYQAGYNSMAHATRTMQLQQSAELTKLEAEL